MSYCWPNYRTKKALKEAIQNKVNVSCFNPGLGGDLSNHTGKVYLEGPHAPLPHRWYATGEMIDGKLVKVS